MPEVTLPPPPPTRSDPVRAILQDTSLRWFVKRAQGLYKEINRARSLSDWRLLDCKACELRTLVDGTAADLASFSLIREANEDTSLEYRLDELDGLAIFQDELAAMDPAKATELLAEQGMGPVEAFLDSLNEIDFDTLKKSIKDRVIFRDRHTDNLVLALTRSSMKAMENIHSAAYALGLGSGKAQSHFYYEDATVVAGVEEVVARLKKSIDGSQKQVYQALAANEDPTVIGDVARGIFDTAIYQLRIAGRAAGYAVGVSGGLASDLTPAVAETLLDLSNLVLDYSVLAAFCSYLSRRIESGKRGSASVRGEVQRAEGRALSALKAIGEIIDLKDLGAAATDTLVRVRGQVMALHDEREANGKFRSYATIGKEGEAFACISLHSISMQAAGVREGSWGEFHVWPTDEQRDGLPLANLDRVNYGEEQKDSWQVMIEQRMSQRGSQFQTKRHEGVNLIAFPPHIWIILKTKGGCSYA